jgi:hypothetical protein
MSYTDKYISKYGFIPAESVRVGKQAPRAPNQQFFDNLEICIREEFDEKIQNNNSSNFQEQINDLKDENNRLFQELTLLKQALADTLSALATK